jgi:hypothetical protein
LVERYLCKVDVRGSIPLGSTSSAAFFRYSPNLVSVTATGA